MLTVAACGGETTDGAARATNDGVRQTALLTVHDAWSRTADSGATAAVYFSLHNSAAEADTLVGVASDIADETMMHVSMEHGGTMRMAHVTSLPVPARDSVAFQPLGAHVMLSGLRRPLVAGDTIALTLRFSSGRTVGVRSGVRQP
ncbi:MAG: copper chaperone PCu(A)C [Gemmatimonadaceae bacterium]|nr:copper chaperone PCu(A)C [Gemmatimonadaceae bacterium]